MMRNPLVTIPGYANVVIGIVETVLTTRADPSIAGSARINALVTRVQKQP